MTTGLPRFAKRALMAAVCTDGVWDDLRVLDGRIKERDHEIDVIAAADPVARRLQQLRGVGPMTATALPATVGRGERRVSLSSSTADPVKAASGTTKFAGSERGWTACGAYLCGELDRQIALPVVAALTVGGQLRDVAGQRAAAELQDARSAPVQV